MCQIEESWVKSKSRWKVTLFRGFITFFYSWIGPQERMLQLTVLAWRVLFAFFKRNSANSPWKKIWGEREQSRKGQKKETVPALGWALHQHSWKPLCNLSFHSTVAALVCWFGTGLSSPWIVWFFTFSVTLSVSSQNLLFKRTTTDRRILSTTSLINIWICSRSFSVWLSCQSGNLSPSPVLGRDDTRASGKESEVTNTGCVSVSNLVLCFPFFCLVDSLYFSNPLFAEACLTTNIFLSHFDFRFVWPDEYTSFSVTVVSWHVTTVPSSDFLSVYWSSYLLHVGLAVRHSQVDDGWGVGNTH